MKALVRYLPLVFVGVAVITVAHFAGPLMVLDVLGYVFAVGIALAIFSAGYYSNYRDDRKGTKQEKVQAVRRWAWAVWGIFGVIDGTLNLSALYMKVIQRPVPPKPLEWIGIVLIGVFPAVAAGCLGIFSALLDNLPSTAKEKRAERDSVASAGRKWLVEWFSAKAEAGVAKPRKRTAPRDNGRKAHTCPYCERKFAKPQGVSAHLRHCDTYRAHRAQAAAQEAET